MHFVREEISDVFCICLKYLILWLNSQRNVSKSTFHNISQSLRWHLNGHDGVSNHQPHHCLLNRLFGCRSKNTSKLRVTGLCAGYSPGTGEFPAYMACYAENVSIWWRHHVFQVSEWRSQEGKHWKSVYQDPTRLLVSHDCDKLIPQQCGVNMNNVFVRLSQRWHAIQYDGTHGPCLLGWLYHYDIAMHQIMTVMVYEIGCHSRVTVRG